MKKISIIILILAAVLAVVLLVVNGIEKDHVDEGTIDVGLLDSYVPEYYGRQKFKEFILTDDEITVLHSVWDSNGHENVYPNFVILKDLDARFYVSNGKSNTYEFFTYNSETGYLTRRVSISKTVFKFEKMRPVFEKRYSDIESYTIVSGENKDKLDEIVAKYRIGVSPYSSVILERTLFAPDSSEGKREIDLSSTFYIPDSEGRIPEIPEAVTEYLKMHYYWCAVDSVRTFENSEYKNDSVYILNIRVHWDETHDRIYVLEYDAQSDAFFSSEFEDIDPENGAKYSPFYDEIFIWPKIRKDAESIFPSEKFGSNFGYVKLDYLPDEPSIKHIPVGMTYMEYVENCSDEDFEIGMNMYQKSLGMEIDLDAVKEFMVKWNIDYIQLFLMEGDDLLLLRQGNWVYEDRSGRRIYD